ncbi:MAG: 2-keto-3-deoxygluconate kinase [Candidatus Tectimicrobiota bacterium]|nr:MAG: 2-keto-3-deoxygluconate kinase [Candidatus Tectomicrobia bacterium]
MIETGTLLANPFVAAGDRAVFSYDVITLGETMLRLTPPGTLRLEQTAVLEVAVGGSEANVAVGLARLGLRVAWLSRLTDNPLGRRIARTLAAQGVDVAHLVWTPEDRVGLYFFEPAPPPRGHRVLYDRRHSALSRMRPEELPAALFQPQAARLLHLSGITPALGPAAAATARRAVELAKAAGWQVSFDVNYRRQLWTPEAARQGCEPFLHAADLVFAPASDVRLLFGLAATASPQAVLEQLAARYRQATLVLTLGREGALAQAPSGERRQQPALAAEAVERLGGGDAFAAGFLYAYLTAPAAERLALALRWGVAMAALKYTIPGDLPLVERHEVEALLAQEGEGPALHR